MNLSPSQNNLLKSLSITPLQVVIPGLQTSKPALQQVPSVVTQSPDKPDKPLLLNESLLLDLQLILPTLSQIILGNSFGIEANRLIVPASFNFDASGKKRLWQFLQQQYQA